MRVAIIGAGPAGLLLGKALTSRGHTVVAVDRDPGPPAEGTWARRGVMQFHHAHAVRAQVGQVLRQEWPEAFDAWRGLGAEPITMDVPGVGEVPTGFRSRRETFERALRTSAPGVPGFTIHKGHVDGLVMNGGTVGGIVVDGEPMAADLVIDASGRSGKAVDEVRAPSTVGGACGLAYVDRQYQLREGAEPGPMTNAIAWQANFDGYVTLVFLHEHGHFSVLIVRSTIDGALKPLRHQDAFEAAARSIPGLADWTDPDRSVPRTDVLPGGPLRNAYRSQAAADGRPFVPGLVSVGDAVATTTPTFGRGLATTFLQVQELLAELDGGADPVTVAEPFDAWCETSMLPWVQDHVHMDGDQARRWDGGDVDLGTRLPSDLIMAAAEVDPAINEAIPGYVTMRALPDCLDPAEPLAHKVYESGWRPPLSDGPNRAELVDIITAASPAL